MLCEKCNKNQATVFYQQNINGQQTEYHICGECAKKMNIMNMQPAFSNLFSGFLNEFSMPQPFIKSSYSDKNICPKCSSTINDIRETGRLGCSECYNTFGEYLENVFKKIQPGVSHTGKIPRKTGGEMKIKRELDTLKLKLARAIENEEYEEAAKLRDKIKGLEKE